MRAAHVMYARSGHNVPDEGADEDVWQDEAGAAAQADAAAG
jgi:hypothetical protein